MTSLEDKAKDTAEVVLARESHGLYRVEDTELVPADDLGTDEFPQYGEFLHCTALSRSGEEQGEIYVETTENLARNLVDLGVEAGDTVLLRNVAKDVDGNWTYETERNPDL